jgi:putative SOS response-associated peptidase YedK
MCGRFTLKASRQAIKDRLALAQTPSIEPRYNIAPTQPVAVVRAIRTKPGTKERELVMLRWGLVPYWADDLAIGNRMINARAESVAERPAFREAFRKRRCLVVTDGFYEWKRADGKKQPYYITMKDGGPFAFAGLWEAWEREGEIIESCTIVTTNSNELVAEIHDRMPVIVDAKDYDVWLDPEVKDLEVLEGLLRPYPSEQMMALPVSRLINDPKNEDAKCVEPMTESAQEPFGLLDADDKEH